MSNAYHNGRASHDGGKYLQHDLRRYERDENLDEGADGRRPEKRSVGVRAGQLVAVGVGGAEAVGVHLRKGTEGNGDDGK